MAVYRIGWGKGDITPHGAPASLCGQFHTRITEEIRDPLSATCMYVESDAGASIWVACDACSISGELCDETEAALAKVLEGFEPGQLMLSATHIHTGPYNKRGGMLSLTGDVTDDPGAMTAAEYRVQMVEGIVKAVLAAKADLKDVSVELAVAPVITGVNRRACYTDGTRQMYGSLDREDFYRMEARDGGPTQLLYVYAEPGHTLDGVVANVPCTAQCDEMAEYITADYWGVVRERLEKDWGREVNLLPIIRAAGDLSPHPMVDRIAGLEEFRWGRVCCDTMGNWVADVIELFKNRPLRMLKGEVHRHVSRDFELPVWPVSDEEYKDAKAYMNNPEKFDENGKPREAFQYANAWTQIRRVERDGKTITVRVNATRMDEVVLISMPFEVYIAYADRIRQRVPQAIVFDIELAHACYGYLATREAIDGGNNNYSANIFNGVCHPDGGELFVEECADIIKSLF